MKQYRSIGITFTPTQSQANSIKRHWTQKEREQSQRAFEADLNEEPHQFEILENENFEWNDELYEEAFGEIIREQIYKIIPFYRDEIFEKIINNLSLFDERFDNLFVINLKKTFYNKHNALLKKRYVNGNLTGQNLKNWEHKLNDYITESNTCLAITSLDAVQG